MTQQPSLQEHRDRYARAIRAAAEAGTGSFLGWFDQAADPRQSLVRGYWDFALHVLTPAVCSRLERPEDRTALEIGYGGGRLLNAACRFFGEAVGIDVHDEAEAVDALLRAQGNDNFRLVRSDGQTIPVGDEEIDFVYSFIVFQHLPSFDVFRSYVAEVRRVLRPGGVAHIYFGRLDARRPLIAGGRRYVERPDVPANDNSLLVRPSVARHAWRAAGFEIVDSGGSFKRVPDGYPRVRGGQDYVTAVKPR